MAAYLPLHGRPSFYVLAFDGSEHAQAAVDFLVDLARRVKPAGTVAGSAGSDAPGLAVTLLSVLPTQHLEGHEALRSAQQRIRAALNDLGIQTAVELTAGSPAATINDYAAEHCADLILVGAKGLRATLGILLGGVAQQVVEYSSCPVLVVRAPYRPVQRILLLADGSKHSQAAAAYLLGRAGGLLPQDIEVHVMHVLPPTISPEMALRTWVTTPEAFYPPPMSLVDIAALEAEELEQGEALLAQATQMLRDGGLNAIPVLQRGDAAAEVLQYMVDAHIDLIVCGSRGLNPVQSWLLGSVSRKLVHYAGCSVLVVK